VVTWCADRCARSGGTPHIMLNIVDMWNIIMLLSGKVSSAGDALHCWFETRQRDAFGKAIIATLTSATRIVCCSPSSGKCRQSVFATVGF
jgi:hypothetical protein